jgi:fermentation-respiration switch protein FrsA (DUF1100 family)
LLVSRETIKLPDMKIKPTIILSLSIIFILSSLWAPVPTLAQTPQPTPSIQPGGLINDAQHFLDQLASGDYIGATGNFESQMKQAAPPEKLAEIWQGLIQQYGAYQRQTGARQTAEDSYNIVYITTQFDNGTLDFKVVFDQHGQIAGFFLTQAGSSAAPEYQPPSYAKKSAFSEQEVTVGQGEWALPGTLTLPNGPGPFPAVVLVHGSGPNNRDETIGPNKPFRDLAEGLASQGIAVLRYEKRTREHGAEMAPLADSITVEQETIEDALSAVQLLRQTPNIDPQRVFVLGHSLGAMLAPRIASQDSGLAGLILLAGPTRPLEDLILDQSTYLASLDGTVSPLEESQLETIRQQVARVKDPTLSSETPASELPLNIPATYWLDLRDYNPALVASSLSIPMLILQGERDYQVSMIDFTGWQQSLAGKENALLRSYPGLNHLFIQGSGPSTPAEYEKAGHISEPVVQDIASFIKTGSLKTRFSLFGGLMTQQELLRLALLLLPIVLIQLGMCIYALVDLARRPVVRGTRWLWAVLLVVMMFSLPTGIIVSGLYLAWGRHVEVNDDPDRENR